MTCGMLIANAPIVFLGKVFANRLPLAAVRRGAAILFAVRAMVFLVRGLRSTS